MTYQAEELRPGWTYLQGQHKPDELKDAIVKADDAWQAYYNHVEDMCIYGLTQDEEAVKKMNDLRKAAVEADKEKDRIYKIVNCPHEHKEVQTIGHQWFDHETGEPEDDFHDVLVCVDCGKIFDEEE